MSAIISPCGLYRYRLERDLGGMLDRVFAVMAMAPQHTFQVLTKRSARMRAYLSSESAAHRIARACGDLMMAGHLSDVRGKPNRIYERTVRHPQDADGWLPETLWAWPLKNTWLGVSTEDQLRADERVPDLLATPAAVRFVSAEPLLGPIDFASPYTTALFPEKCRERDLALASPWQDRDGIWHEDGVGDELLPGLDWIIVGGESGPNARPMHPAWARDIRDQCAAVGVAFHFKQHGAWAPSPSMVDGLGVGGIVLWPNGDQGYGDEERCGGRGVAMVRVGKKAAGRLLDGVTHDAMPRTLTPGA